MKQKTLVFAALALVLVLGGAALLYPRLAAENHAAAQLPAAQPPVENEAAANEDMSEAAEEPKLAPNFIVYDAEGGEVELARFFDKPVVLNFWASWCSPCRSEMPIFEAVYQAYGDEIHFLMVNATHGRESQKSAEDFLAEEGYTFPVYFDLTTQASITYGAFSLPTTYFLASGGIPVTYAVGAINEESLLQGIGMITE